MRGGRLTLGLLAAAQCLPDPEGLKGTASVHLAPAGYTLPNVCFLKPLVPPARRMRCA